MSRECLRRMTSNTISSVPAAIRMISGRNRMYSTLAGAKLTGMRDLPSAAEPARILATKRTRPIRRPPASAGRRLSGLIKQLDERFGSGPETLQARWREIVGENLAARTEPVKLSRPRNGSGGVLELKVDG